MIPDRDNSKRVPDCTKGDIADKKKEVAIVVLTEAIVYPRTMMIHRKHALIAHLAVRGAGWLNLIANLASSLPYLFQILARLVPILHHRLNLSRNAFEPL